MNGAHPSAEIHVQQPAARAAAIVSRRAAPPS